LNLRLLQLGDSALPIGGYSHSWGLEAAIAGSQVRDPPGLERWTRSWLRYSVGPFEGVVVGAVHRAAAANDWPTIQYANELVRVALTPTTLRHASHDMGEQLLALAGVWPWAAERMDGLRRLPVDEWHHGPVFATLTAAAGAAPEEALLLYLNQSALAAIGAGVRAIPIGHTHGQEVLARLHDELQSLAGELVDRPLETAGSLCPAYEMLCHAQSELYTRLFRS
jgi:urease accessory protein